MRTREDEPVTSSAATPTDPADLLQRVRARIEAQVQDGTAGTPTEVRSPTSLRPLPTNIETTLDERKHQRLSPSGSEYPRQAVLKIAGVAAAVGAVGIVILALGLVTGDIGLIVIGAAELVIFGGGGIGLYRYAQRDPLRLSSTQLATIENSRRWTPAPGSDDALLAVATSSAQRIVDSPAWRSGSLTAAGVRIPLGPALDAIAAGSPADDTRLTRVAALAAYADTVEALRGGAGELDASRVEVLAFLLSSAIHDRG